MLKFNEAKNKMKDEEKNMRMEMTNLVSEHNLLKKALEFLERTQISTNSEKCSLEQKLGKSEGRCKELEKKIVEMEGKVEKLRREKLQLEKKLGNQSVEELRCENEEWKEKTMESDHLEPRINLEVNEEVMDKSTTEVEEEEEEEENANLSDFGENANIGSSKKGANYRAKIRRVCKLEIIDVIKENLQKENLEIFEQSCFGHLLKINTHQLKFQGQVIFHLMRHIDMSASNNERLVFKINNSCIEFGLEEFSLVTGLDDLGTFEEVTATSSSIHREAFHGRSSIQLKDIEKAFLNVSRYHGGKGELSLKLAFLYLLYGTLLASYNKNIDTQYLHLTEDLHKFNAFPWGRVVYEFLVSSILAARVRMDGFEVIGKKKSVCLNMQGFIFALQIWAYEVIPCLATYCASHANNFDKQTPPILRWHATEIFLFEQLKKFFNRAPHLGLDGIEASPVKRNRTMKSGKQSTDTEVQAETPLSSPQQKKRKLFCEDKDQMPQARDKQSSPTDCYAAEFLEKMDLPGSCGRRMPVINPDLSIPELIKLINEIQSTLMEKEKISRRMEPNELRVGKMKSDKAAQHYQKMLEDLEATLGEKCDASATDADNEKQNVNADTEDGGAMLSPESHEFSKKGFKSLAHSGSEPAYTSAVDARDNEGKEPAGSGSEHAGKDNEGKEPSVADHGCSHASAMCSNVEVPRWNMASGVYHVIVISDSDDEIQDKSKITDYCRVDSKKRSKPGPSTAPSPSPAAADCDSESPLPKFNAATDHVHSAESDDISCSHAYMNLVAALQFKEGKQRKIDV